MSTSKMMAAGTLVATCLASAPAGAVTRCQVIAHGKAWVDAGVMYSEGPNGGYCPGDLYCDPNAGGQCYRPDCSGFVSAVWGLPPPGHTTYYFAGGLWDDGVSYVIPSDQLAPGDALNWGGDPSQGTGHIMLFGGWISGSQLWVYQENLCGTSANYAEFDWNTLSQQGYVPIRYTGIEECNKPPIGWIDAADCNAISGWSQDPDTVDQPIDVGLYFDGSPGDAGVQSFSVHADLHRDDLCQAIGSCNHGFATAPPRSLLDGKPHTVNAYGVDSMGGNDAALSGGPKTFQCDPPVPSLDALHGVKRWIPSPTVLGAWHFDGFRDVAREPDALVASFPDGPDLPDAPVVVQADDGTPEVWVIDSGVRRHVVDVTSLSAWRLDGVGVVVKQPAAQVYQYPKGVDFPAAPFVFASPSDPKVYILDVRLLPPSAGTGGGGVGSGGSSGAGGRESAAGMPTPRAKGGCNCEAGGAGSSDGRSLALVAAALLLVPRRCRRATPSV
jgi:hypothetical protein